jgi:hypothetical protein
MPAQQRQPIQSPNPPDHRPAPIKKASRSSPLIPLHPPQKKSCNNHPEDKPQSKKTIQAQTITARTERQISSIAMDTLGKVPTISR